MASQVRFTSTLPFILSSPHLNTKEKQVMMMRYHQHHRHLRKTRLISSATRDPRPLHEEYSWPSKNKYPRKYIHDEEVKKRVEKVKQMLGSMKDGEISGSPYDTAWVAMVKAIDGSGKPQFPESVEWISENQLEDGSWGDKHYFHPQDRILNTLACVTALTCWNLHHHKCQQGMKFIEENLRKLGDEKEEHMLTGFEVAFPSLIEIAKGLGIHLPPDDYGVLQHIYALRGLKLSRIPKEMMHKKATSLLYSLEGLEGLDLDWDQLIKFQNKGGSFLFSPASTAYALIHTNDLHCFTYLNSVVRLFNGGVPHIYPIDLLERIWAIDRIQRLGISRLFETEINTCLDYVYGNWTEYGIGWARNSEVPDLDMTCMGFRMLRLQGYNVSTDVFQHFKKDGEFLCYGGQLSESVTVMFNFYRASQIQFPGERIMEEAREFSSNYLTQMRASNQLFDKWVILKDFPGELDYALDLPWYASLPRIESRFYIEQYGGVDDVWIGKTLFRMPCVNNNIYLELAKLDFNACQSIHLFEWDNITRWYIDYNLNELGLGEIELLRIYFVVAASIFEPERSNERLAWAKTWAITNAISAYFKRGSSSSSYQERKAFSHQFSNINNASEGRGHGVMTLLENTLNQLSLDVFEAYGIDIRCRLHQAWEKWMMRWAEDGDEYKGVAELVARTIHACSSKTCDKNLDEENHISYNLQLETANKICHKLGHLIFQNNKHCDYSQEDEQGKERSGGGKSESIPREVNSEMQMLVGMVLDSDQSCMKRIVLEVAKGFYYSAYCSPETIDSHLTKVLFQRVDVSKN